MGRSRLLIGSVVAVLLLSACNQQEAAPTDAPVVDTGKPVAHPQTDLVFSGFDRGRYRPKPRPVH